MTTDAPEITEFNEDLWRTLFEVGHPLLIEKQKRFRVLGQAPRCKLCLAPFNGTQSEELGADVPAPSNRNPRYCSMCDVFIRANPGGARVHMTMVFADVRGSTELAEAVELSEYVRLMNNFYRDTSQAIINTDGFMLEVIGDQIFALYPTGFSGVEDGDNEANVRATVTRRQIRAAEKAICAAKEMAKGGQRYASAAPYGVAVHSGEVFIGTIRGAEEGIVDVRVWGKEVNKAARMSAKAKAGEVLFSDEVCDLAADHFVGLERRLIELKGVGAKVGVRVFRAS